MKGQAAAPFMQPRGVVAKGHMVVFMVASSKPRSMLKAVPTVPSPTIGVPAFGVPACGARGAGAWAAAAGVKETAPT